MGLKEKLFAKVTRNAVKSEMDGEVVYLKRSAGIFEFLPKFVSKPLKEWKQIYPPVNEDNSWNWFNLFFGGKKNFWTLILLFILIGLILLQFTELFNYIDIVHQDICFQQCMNDSFQNFQVNSIIPN